jgi:hypothetical protein
MKVFVFKIPAIFNGTTVYVVRADTWTDACAKVEPKVHRSEGLVESMSSCEVLDAEGIVGFNGDEIRRIDK